MIQQNHRGASMVATSPSAKGPFSSNNPFRNSTASQWTVSSTADDQPGDNHLPIHAPMAPPPRRSPINIRSQSPHGQPVPRRTGLDRPTSVMTDFSSRSWEPQTTRRYNPPRATNLTRKSMNPFLEENRMSFEDGDDTEFDKLYPPATAKHVPMRPSSASKPEREHRERESLLRSTSDSSVVNGPPSGLRPKAAAHSLGNSMSSVDKSSSGSHIFGSKPHRTSSSEKDGLSKRDHHHHHSSQDKEKSKDREQRRKERHERREKAKKKLPLDVIDKLDVTGFFGPGSFHHDGPFDACTPHRNKNTNQAPVAAFPIDGVNNSLSAALDPRDKYATEDSIMGRTVDEAYQDFSARAPVNGGRAHGGGLGATTMHGQNGSTITSSIQPASTSSTGSNSPQVTWNPAAKETPVHGDLTMGLGSSTFLDGAPASKEAIAKSSRETTQAGLGRKKSLVQRLKGAASGSPPVNRPHRPATTHRANSDDVMSPVSRTGSAGPVPTAAPSHVGFLDASESKAPGGNGLLRRVKSLKVGGRRRGTSD